MVSASLDLWTPAFPWITLMVFGKMTGFSFCHNTGSEKVMGLDLAKRMTSWDFRILFRFCAVCAAGSVFLPRCMGGIRFCIVLDWHVIHFCVFLELAVVDDEIVVEVAVYPLLFLEHFFYPVHHVDQVGILQTEIDFSVIMEPRFLPQEFVVQVLEFFRIRFGEFVDF